MNDYDDIISYNYNGSKRKNHMSLEQRSSIFSAFQALEGFMDNIKESERITQNKIVLDENKKELLNNKIIYLFQNNIEGTFIYFVKDENKSGGKYKKINGIIKKIDSINKQIVFKNNNKIFIEDIIDVNL